MPGHISRPFDYMSFSAPVSTPGNGNGSGRHFSAPQKISELDPSQLYNDIIIVGSLPARMALFLAYPICPIDVADRRVLEMVKRPGYTEEHELFCELKHPDGSPVYHDWKYVEIGKYSDGSPMLQPKPSAVRMVTEKRTTKVPPSHVVFAGDGNGVGPHRYIVEGREMQFAANFDIETDETRRKMMGKPSGNGHPHIDVTLRMHSPGDLEGSADFHVSTHGRSYSRSVMLMPGRANGIASYVLKNGSIVPYEVGETPYMQREKWGSTIICADMPLASFPIEGSDHADVARTLHSYLGPRITALSIAMFSGNEWDFRIMPTAQLRQADAPQQKPSEAYVAA